MPLKNLIQKSKKYEIQSYKKKYDVKELKKNNVPFTGSPKKHPYDNKKVILLIEPYDNSSYYEFKTKDISHVEELANITNIEEETVPMVRIWVQKKSVGIRCAPFMVEDIKTNFKI